MILYETDEPAWYGTQADAKASGRPFKKRDVPTDKPGLLRWLNLNLSCHAPALEPEPDSNGGLRLRLGKPKPAFEQVTETVTPDVHPVMLGHDTVMEWVLNVASNAQVEQLFSALGARFHEAHNHSHKVHE